MFFAADSGQQIANQNLIHNIRFYDTDHAHDKEGQDTSDEKRVFHAKDKENVRKRIVSSDRQFTIDSYNNQLIRHNKLYSKVVSDFIANSEMIIQYLHSLPQHEVMNKISMEANQINSRFSLIEEQFVQYEKDVRVYKDYLNDVIANRTVARSEGDVNSAGAQE
jgi:hypothetical protein